MDGAGGSMQGTTLLVQHIRGIAIIHSISYCMYDAAYDRFV
jgi:hypothetical protein